jgi:leucyl-tRNA synthetase
MLGEITCRAAAFVIMSNLGYQNHFVETMTPIAVREYKPALIEPQWQERWSQAGLFRTPTPDSPRTASYIKVAWPFTTGRAHLGHVREYCMADAYARYRRARGDAVLYTLGFDSFGLPNEIAAIQNQEIPQEWVEERRREMMVQFDGLGISFDWSRSALSSDPDFYQWTQWVFLKLFERDLIFYGPGPVYWCDTCQTVLAATQAEDGRCWRCDSSVAIEYRHQWFMRLSALAHTLYELLDKMTNWTPSLIERLRFVLGRRDGIKVDMAGPEGFQLTAFTPYPESLAGAAFVAVPLSHPRIDFLLRSPEVVRELDEMKMPAWQRMQRGDDKPVIDTSITVAIPGTNRKLPVLISPTLNRLSDPVAEFGIPSTDRSDDTAARRLGLLIPDAGPVPHGVPARPAIHYGLQNVSISRHRIWGTPIPVIHCPKCGIVPVPENRLPVVLPGGIIPSGFGHPLAEDESFRRTDCPACGNAAERETHTMACQMDAFWASFWPCVPAEERTSCIFEHDHIQQWFPIHQGYWGSDVVTYVINYLFFVLAMQECGYFAHMKERPPTTKVVLHGMVLQDGKKMSKHLGNVVDPSDLVKTYGVDTLRFAIMGAAKPASDMNWSEHLAEKSRKFLDELWLYFLERADWLGQGAEGELDNSPPDRLRGRLHKWHAAAAEKLNDLMDRQLFHLACLNIVQLFESLRRFETDAVKRRGKLDGFDKAAMRPVARDLLKFLAPICPHIAEELWSVCGEERMLAGSPW